MQNSEVRLLGFKFQLFPFYPVELEVGHLVSLCLLLPIWKMGMDKSSAPVAGSMWRINACRVMRTGSGHQSTVVINNEILRISQSIMSGFKLLGDSWQLGMRELPPPQCGWLLDG